MTHRHHLLLGSALAFAVVFWVTGTYTYYLYFEKGVQMLDAGWFASQVAGNDWRLANPVAMRNFVVTDSFYDVHVSPFFIPFIYLNRLLPLSPGEQMALFVGLSFGVYAAALFVAITDFLMAKFPAHPNVVTAVAAIAASVLGLNGIVFQNLIFPHYEAWIPAFICVFLLALLARRWVVVAVVFVLLLSVREDAGLHLAMILLAIVFFRQLRDGNFRPHVLLDKLWSERFLLAIAAAGILYFFISSSVAGREAPQPGGDIVRFLSRLSSIVVRRDWLPLFVALVVWAGLTRRPMVLVGFAACVPWMVYNATLELPFSGFLLGYYGFPILIAFFFPFVAERFFDISRPAALARKADKGQKRDTPPPAVTPTAAAVLVVFTVAASLLFRPLNIARDTYEGRPWPNYGFKPILEHGIVPPPAAMRDNIKTLRAFYNAYKDEMKIVVDDGFAAPHVHDVPAGGLLMNGADATLLQDDIDILIIHKIWLSRQQSRHATAARAVFSLQHSYLLQDTKFFLFSKTPLCENGECIGGLPLVEVQLEGAFAARAAENFTKHGFYFNPLSIVKDGIAVENGVAVTEATGIVTEIHGVPLAAGKVALHLEYSHTVADGDLPLFQAAWEGGEESKELPFTDGQLAAFQIPVALEEPKYISMRLYHRGGGVFKLHRLTILPVQ